MKSGAGRPSFGRFGSIKFGPAWVEGFDNIADAFAVCLAGRLKKDLDGKILMKNIDGSIAALNACFLNQLGNGMTFGRIKSAQSQYVDMGDGAFQQGLLDCEDLTGGFGLRIGRCNFIAYACLVAIHAGAAGKDDVLYLRLLGKLNPFF